MHRLPSFCIQFYVIFPTLNGWGISEGINTLLEKKELDAANCITR